MNPSRPLQTLTDAEEVVLDDLEFLRQTFWQDDLSENELRRSSNILRRLIIDGLLQRVASSRSISLQIPCPRNEWIAKRYRHLASLYVCGCVTLRSGTFGVILVTRGANPPQSTPLPEDPLNDRQLLSLGKFRAQVSIMWHGVIATREDIIKYVCHKLGGVHFDETRREKPSIRLVYRALDLVRPYWRLGAGFKGEERFPVSPGFDAVYFELLATGRFLTESPSVIQLMDLLLKARDQSTVHPDPPTLQAK